MKYFIAFLILLCLGLASCKSLYVTRSGKTLSVTVDSTVTFHGSEFSR